MVAVGVGGVGAGLLIGALIGGAIGYCMPRSKKVEKKVAEPKVTYVPVASHSMFSPPGSMADIYGTVNSTFTQGNMDKRATVKRGTTGEVNFQEMGITNNDDQAQ